MARGTPRRGVEWKIFEDINFVNRKYEPFDASDWPLMPSGLLGPVRLLPLKRMCVSGRSAEVRRYYKTSCQWILAGV